MAINKTPSGWRVFLYLGRSPDGKVIRKTKLFEKLGDAKKWEAEMLSAHNKGVNIVGSTTLFKVLAMEWYNNICLKKDSINTSYNKLSVLNAHLLPAFGELPLNKISTEVVQRFYFSLNDSGMKSSTSKKIIATLNNVMKYGLKQGKIPYLPTGIEKLPVVKMKIQFWTEDQLRLFLDHLRNDEEDLELYIAVFLVSMTGIRSAELMGIQLKKYDPVKRLLEVNAQVIKDKASKQLWLTDTMKTSSSSRILTLPKVLCTALDDYIERLPNKGKNNFLIGDKHGDIHFYDNLRMKFNRRIQKIRKEQEKRIREEQDASSLESRISEADIEDMLLPVIKFYELRHTHATILLNSGENIKVISERLGHKTITTTLDTYASIMQKSRAKTADLLDNIFL